MDNTEDQVVVRERVVRQPSAASQWPAVVLVMLALGGSIWLAASVPSDNSVRVTSYTEPAARTPAPVDTPLAPAPTAPN